MSISVKEQHRELILALEVKHMDSEPALQFITPANFTESIF